MSSAQKQRVERALEESLQRRVAHMNRLKESIQVIKVDLDAKSLRKDELTKLCTETRSQIQYPFSLSAQRHRTPSES